MRRVYLVSEDVLVSLMSMTEIVFKEYSLSEEEFRKIRSRVDLETFRENIRVVPGIVPMTIEESEMLNL